MLIETPYKANDTITLKTLTGEEIIARYVEETETTITVSKPMVLMASQQGIGLGPFAFSVSPDKNYKLNKGTLVFIHATDDEIGKQYIESTSDIKLA